jgi:Ca2+-binding RTX toxin-like protein
MAVIFDDGLFGIGQSNNIQGSNVSDTIYGGTSILGIGTGNDVINGNDGNDVIYAGDGNDTVHGNDDHDTIYGDLGDDNLYGDSGNDDLYGGVGDDDLYGGAGHDYLDADRGNDRLYGGSGNDHLMGGTYTPTYLPETDYLYGGSGNDVTESAGYNKVVHEAFGSNAAREVDTMIGGKTLGFLTGEDVFELGDAYGSYYSRSDSYAVIRNFDAGQDIVRLISGNSSNYTLAVDNNFTINGQVIRAGNDAAQDTALMRNGDVIAIFEDTVGLDLNAGYFKF